MAHIPPRAPAAPVAPVAPVAPAPAAPAAPVAPAPAAPAPAAPVAPVAPVAPAAPAAPAPATPAAPAAPAAPTKHGFWNWVKDNPRKSIAGLAAALFITFGAERTVKHGFAYGCDFIKFCYNKGLYGWVYDSKENAPASEFKTTEFSTSDGRSYILSVPAVHQPRVLSAIEIYNRRLEDKSVPDAEKRKLLENFMTAVYNADVADGLKDDKTNDLGARTFCSLLEGKLDSGKIEHSAK